MPRFVMGATALTVVALASSSAFAQFFDRPYGPYTYNNPPPLWGVEPRDDRARPLSPIAIVNRLEDRGFDDVGRPRYDGSTYTVDATAPNGRRVRLVIDAFRGQLLDRVPLGRAARDEDDDAPPRAFSRRGEPPPEMPFFEAEPRARPMAPRREAARPVEPAQPAEPTVRAEPSPSRTLRPPVDPRLAPSPSEGRSETAPARREAARPAPSGAPYGVNPGSPGAARRAPAEAARPAVTPSPAAPPAATSAAPTPPTRAEANADPARSSRPVRVIEGVTPLNPDGPKPPAEPSEAP